MRSLLVLVTALLLAGSAAAHEGQVVAGMAGNRAFVVFSGPEEMKDFLKRTC